MRRLTKGLAIAAGLTLTLAACGSDDDGDSGAEAESGSSLTIWADEKTAGPIETLATQWGDDNGVEVVVTQIVFDDIKDQFIQQAPAGQGPDVLLGKSDWVGEFTASGLIAPIDLGANKDSFTEASVDVFTLDGQNYAVPYSTENILLFRNTDLAPEAPATLNEMAETGLQLQADGKTQFPIGLQVNGDAGDAYHAYPFLSAAGGYFFGGPDADGNYDVDDRGIANEGGLTFANAWGQWGADGVVKTTFTGDDLTNAWNTGALPYWVTGPWNKPVVEDSGVPFSAEGIPGWDGVDSPSVPIVGASGFLLSQNSANATTAQAFLDATMNTEFMDALYQADPRPPAWKESAEAAADDPVIAAVAEFGADGFPNLAYSEMSIMYEEVGLAQAKILDGADPEATMQEADATIAERIE